MSYTLQAIVGNVDVLVPLAGDLPVVVLPQGKVMIPLGTDVREKAGAIPWLPLTDDALGAFPEALSALCKKLSANGRVVYLEAELFGGAGTQAMLVAERGEIIEGPRVDVDAINTALQAIGVAAGAEIDEFAALRLDRHRDTDEWLPGPREAR